MELAKKIGISPSQLSRIVSGETKTVISDILIGIAKEFRVSTDYILGLSEGAVRRLVTGMIDVEILNRLLEHKNFPRLISLIQIYFQDTAARGVMARNQVIEIATASLADLMKDRPEYRTEARQDIQFMNVQKLGEHEAEIEKIKNVFMSILRDIKGDIDNGEPLEEPVTAVMFQNIQNAAQEQKQELHTIDDVTALVAEQIEKVMSLDEETNEQFQQLLKKMIEQAGK